MNLKTRGLVIGEQTVKESNRYITVLTESEGLIRATAYGAQKTSSPISAQTRLFACADFNFSQRNGYYKVESADTVATFFELSESVENVAVASYFCELLSDVAIQGVADGEILRLALYALYALAKKGASHRLVKAVFELRLMALSGYEPELYYCGECGCEVNGEALFSVTDGVLICMKCPRKNSSECFVLTPSALEAMRYILTAPMEKLFRFTLGKESETALCTACEAYVLKQLDRNYRALDVYKSVAAFSAAAGIDA